MSTIVEKLQLKPVPRYTHWHTSTVRNTIVVTVVQPGEGGRRSARTFLAT